MQLNLNSTEKQIEETVKLERRKATGSNVLWIFLITAVYLCLCYFFYNEYIEGTRFNQEIQKAHGTLKDNYLEIASRRGAEYQVEYGFVVNGNKFDGIDTIKIKPLSKEIIVIYDPKNPSHNKLESSVYNSAGAGFFLVVISTIGYLSFLGYVLYKVIR